MAENEKKAGNTLHVAIVTPYEIFFDGTCDLLVVPSADGEIGIMYHHMPLATALYPGELRLHNGEECRYCFVSNGYVQVENEFTIVVCTAAEWADKIDPVRAKNALDRARERLQKPGLTIPEKKRTQHAIRRANMRLSVIANMKARQEEKTDTQ